MRAHGFLKKNGYSNEQIVKVFGLMRNARSLDTSPFDWEAKADRDMLSSLVPSIEDIKFRELDGWFFDWCKTVPLAWKRVIFKEVIISSEGESRIDRIFEKLDRLRTRCPGAEINFETAYFDPPAAATEMILQNFRGLLEPEAASHAINAIGGLVVDCGIGPELIEVLRQLPRLTKLGFGLGSLERSSFQLFRGFQHHSLTCLSIRNNVGENLVGEEEICSFLGCFPNLR